MKHNKKQITFRKFLVYIFSIIVVVFAVLLLRYSKEVSAAVVVSINSCLSVIVPSLFGFMVVSNFLVKSNLYILISKPFSIISRYIFRIPTELFSIFLLSNIGGYPIGAKMISELIKNERISNKDANTMMCYCFCSGPAFIIGAIGIKVFSSVSAGLIIYISIFISNFLIAIILGLKNKIPQKENKCYKININSNILIESIEATAKTLLMICSTLIFFAIIIASLEVTGIMSIFTNLFSIMLNFNDSYTVPLIKGIFEISTINQLPQFCYILIPIVTAIVAFGGICVFFQILGISKDKIKLKRFLLTRPIQIFFSGIISFVLVKIFGNEIAVETFVQPFDIKFESNSIIPGLCLIFMTALLLFSNKKLKTKYSKND